MGEQNVTRFPPVGDGSDLAPAHTFYREEVQLANRNRGMPLEGLRYDVTPTGMHYLLVHFDIPHLDAAEWRLNVGGRVSRPLSPAHWTGPPLRGVLQEANLNERAVELLFTGLDRGVQGDEVQDYQRSLAVDEATRDEVLLAYEMNGRPLEPQHGFPLRLLVPGWYGMASVKWLHRVDAVAEPFQGCQMVRRYS